VIKLYEIDWGAQPFYWEVYDENDNFVACLEANQLDDYLDFVRSIGVDFILYTQDWYQYNLAMGGAVA
jgi:hypothetical protein